MTFLTEFEWLDAYIKRATGQGFTLFHRNRSCSNLKGQTMAFAADTDAPGYRGHPIDQFPMWLEIRVRRTGDSCALTIWGAIGLCLFLVWVPALGYAVL